MINMKKAYEKDEKGQDTPTLKVDGRQCIVFKPENITFRYSTNTVLS